MTALVALGMAAIVFAIMIAAIWALLAWRRNRQLYEILAERLVVDSRLEQLTAQTLAAMRDVARRSGGLS